jgi:hypothetical protein
MGVACFEAPYQSVRLFRAAIYLTTGLFVLAVKGWLESITVLVAWLHLNKRLNLVRNVLVHNVYTGNQNRTSGP